MEEHDNRWRAADEFYGNGRKIDVPSPQESILGHPHFWQIVALVCLVLLVVFAGIITYLLVVISHSSSSTVSGTGTGKLQRVASSPPAAVATSTLPTPFPTATPIPTPMPSPTPTRGPGTVLCQAGQTWSGWSGSQDWKVFNGMLINTGTAEGGGPTILAPCDVGDVADYAVEADIQVVNWHRCCIAQFAIVVRAVSSGGSWQGYSVGDDIASFAGPQYVAQASATAADYSSSLGTAPFDPGTAWHTYRVEVKGNKIKLIIDGGVKLDVTDNTNTAGGQVGLWSFGVQLSIRSFKITQL